MDAAAKPKEMISDDAAVQQAADKEKQQRSFERSLAGPSVGKAGLARDQTEINRIIAEVSKGSKFYQNQVRKDKELSDKILWFQNKRDELLAMASVERLEADADKILVEVEATRDLSQTIVHVDMDAFYAAVEVKRDPSLKGKPFGVGRGVLTTASYEARKYGCRSGMAGFVARKLCPEIILTELHFDLYSKASMAVREVLLKYDDNLMMAGLDEGYLNITSYMAEHDMTALKVVTQLRAEVEAATGMTISAGIAPNRMLAKICSDQNKPNGQYAIEFDRAAITKFMRDLPVRKIPGFGRVTERCLEGLGVETCGDVYTRRGELLAMNHWFGFRGLCKAFLGIADNHVEPHKRGERKSVGVERTFRDMTNDEAIIEELEHIADELHKDLERLEYSGKTVTVKFKLHTYESKSRAHSVKRYISTKEEILPIALELIRKEFPLRIRLLGIRLSNLKDLRVPDHGIKNFLAAPKASSSKPHTDTVDLTQLEDGIEGVAQEETYDSKEGSPMLNMDPSPRHDGPTCPICTRQLPADTTNSELNEHIDLCLNRELFSGADSPSASPPKRAASSAPDTKNVKKRRTAKPHSGGKGSVLDWLKRAQ